LFDGQAFVFTYTHKYKVERKKGYLIVYTRITGISPNLSFAAANGTNLTSNLVPVAQATGLCGGGAAALFSRPHAI